MSVLFLAVGALSDTGVIQIFRGRLDQLCRLPEHSHHSKLGHQPEALLQHGEGAHGPYL